VRLKYERGHGVFITGTGYIYERYEMQRVLARTFELHFHSYDFLS
jgi:hypothetical protein